jgi:ABC-type siderophore export system fused ATPase/permease subunit
MARAPQLQQRLTRVSDGARRRLNGIDAMLPEKPDAMPFEEYLARAAVHADRDPAFRDQFKAAMGQYQTAGKVLKNGST